MPKENPKITMVTETEFVFERDDFIYYGNTQRGYDKRFLEKHGKGNKDTQRNVNRPRVEGSGE